MKISNRGSPDTRQHLLHRLKMLVTLLALPALGVVADVSVVDSLKAVLLIGVQVALGASLISISYRGVQSTSSVGLSFAVGSCLATVLDQALLGVGFENISLIAQIVVAGALFAQNQRTGKRDLLKTLREMVTVISSTRSAWLLVIALLLLVPGWVWTFPMAIALALILLVIERQTSERHLRSTPLARTLVTLAGIGLAICLVFLSIATRPRNWWLFDEDTLFYEGMSVGKALFGADANLYIAGVDQDYHWFGNAWMGMIFRIGGFEHFIVLTRIAPIVLALAAAALIMAILRLLQGTRNVVVLAILIATTTTFEITERGLAPIDVVSIGASLAMVLALALVFVTMRVVREDTWLELVIIAILAIGLFGSRSFIALPVFLGIAVVLLIQVFVNRSTPTFSIVRLLTLVGTSSFAFLYFYGSPRGEKRSIVVSVGNPFDFVNTWGDTAQSNSIIVAYGLLLLVGFVGIAFVCSVMLTFGSHRTEARAFGVFTLVTTISATILAVFSQTISGTSFFFLVPIPVLGTISASIAIDSSSRFTTRQRVAACTVGAIALAGGILSAWSGEHFRLQSGLARISLRFLSAALLLPTLFLCGLVAWVLGLFRKRSGPSNSPGAELRSVIAVSCLLFGTGIFVSNWFEAVNQTFPVWRRQNQYLLPVKTELAVADWIKVNIPRQDLLAGNQPSYLLPPLTERQWFASGGSFASDGSDSPSQRFDLSRRFAETAGEEELRQLTKVGVQWFVIDVQSTYGSAWSDSSRWRPIYSNERFKVFFIGKDMVLGR